MKKEDCHKILFRAFGKEITIYPSITSGRPIVYLNTFEGEGERAYQMLRDAECPDFTLVTISGLAWHHDLTPGRCLLSQKALLPAQEGQENICGF